VARAYQAANRGDEWARTLAVSAGPDGVVDAPFRTRVLLTRDSDDVLGIVSTGKDGGAAAPDEPRSPTRGAPTTGAATNLCAGAGPKQNP